MQQLKTFKQVQDFNGILDIHFNMLAGEKMKLSGSSVFRSNKIELPTLEKAKIREDYVFVPFRLLNRYPGLNYKDGDFYGRFGTYIEDIGAKHNDRLYLCDGLVNTYTDTEALGDRLAIYISPTTSKAFIRLKDYTNNLPALFDEFRDIGAGHSTLEQVINQWCKNDWRLLPTFILRTCYNLGIYSGKTEWKNTENYKDLKADEIGAIEFYAMVLYNLFTFPLDEKHKPLPLKTLNDVLTIEDYYFQQARIKTFIDIYNYEKLINIEYTSVSVNDVLNATFVTALLKYYLKCMPVMFWKLPFEPLALTPLELDNPLLNPYDITKERIELRLGQRLDDITYEEWLKKVLRLWNNAERVKHIAKHEVYLNESEIRENAGPNTGNLHACINGGQRIDISVTADEIGILFVNTYLDYAPIFSYGRGIQIPQLSRNDLFKPLSKVTLWDADDQWPNEWFSYSVMTRSLLGLKPNQIATGSVFSPLENDIYPAWDFGRWTENYLKVFAERVPFITMYRGLQIESDIFID